MTVWAVGMMRDEADVAYHVLQHLASEGVDGIVVADNLSTDGTLLELQAAAVNLDCQVHIVDDDDPGYWQSQKMTCLARQAAELGATWIVPFDADELWFAHSDRLAATLERQPAEVSVVQVPMFNHFATALDGDDPNPFRRITYRQNRPGALPKTAFRFHESVVVEQGNHAVTYDIPTVSVASTDLEIRHFPYRSLEHFRRKAANGLAAYRATDLPEHEGAHWRQYGQLLETYGPDALDEVWRTWFWFLAPCNADLVLDPAPLLRWQK